MTNEFVPNSSATQPEALAWSRIARFYDADYRHYDADLALIADLVADLHADTLPNRKPPIRLLDLGCGTGRVLVPLARAGEAITGVDNSPALLEVTRAKLSRAGVALGEHVELLDADLQTLALPHRDYALAFCLSNTLMHLPTQAAQLDLLRRARHHLREDGLLLLDLFNPDVARLVAAHGLMELADSWRDEQAEQDATIYTTVCKWVVRRVDWATQQQETLFLYEEIFDDGRTRRTSFPFTLRFLWPAEITLLLHVAGFEVEAVWGDFEGAPHDDASEQIVLLARKTNENPRPKIDES